MKDYNYLQQKYVVNTYPNRGLVIEKGEGIYLIDDKGQKYLDLMGNYGVNIFGYNHPVINTALINQINKVTALHGSFTSSVRAEAAARLVQRCGGNLTQVFFSNSGAEANEAALKFAVLATGRHKFVTTRKAYHGKTIGALSATDGYKYRQAFEPLLLHFDFVDYNNVDQLERSLTDEIAAFIVEPLQGDGGIRLSDTNYLKKVKEVCQRKGVLLIVDEVQSGVGRTGLFLASHESNLDYDIVTMGKGLAGGLPVGATLVSQKVAASIPKLSHTSTFGGNPLACAGILAVLELLDESILQHIQETGEYFLQQLSGISSTVVAGVRGKGFMIGIEMKDKRNETLKELQKNYILTIPASDNVIRLLPPYLLQKKQIDNAMEKFSAILCAVS